MHAFGLAVSLCSAPQRNSMPLKLQMCAPYHEMYALYQSMLWMCEQKGLLYRPNLPSERPEGFGQLQLTASYNALKQ